MYESQLRQQPSQGDIIDDVPFAYHFPTPDGKVQVEVRYVRAIMITYDCEYDKPSAKYIHVAIVLPLSAVKNDQQGIIRHKKSANTFYLESTSGLPESYVDFRFLERIDKSAIESLTTTGKRIASLNDTERERLQMSVAYFFGLGRQGQIV